jgi:hypothetical protein
MTIGLYETRLRRRRRIRWAAVRWILVVAAIGGAGAFAYKIGSTQEQHQLTRLRAQVDDLTNRLAVLRQQNTSLQADAMIFDKRLSDAQKEIPSGPVADLLARVQEKLDAGVDIERLQFLVNAAATETPCSGLPTRKRFIVQTPLFTGANDSVSYADGTITVTARGESAVNSDGKAESWFDPARPIDLVLTLIGGKVFETPGKLPVHASVIVDDREYRFTATAGPQGFIQVTGERCELSR